VSNTRRIVAGLGLLALIGAAIFVVALAAGSGTFVTVEWSTASELDTAGFNLYRGESQAGPFTRLNSELIPGASDPLVGGTYVYTDTNVIPGHTYYYRLEDVDTTGAANQEGVVQVTAGGGLDPALLALVAAVLVVSVIAVVRLSRKRYTGPAEESGESRLP
jgi:hypothetical protein